MWDFLRAFFRSTADKQQEQLNAYLDNALPPQERRDFEQTLKADAALQATLADLRLLKANLAQLPRQRAPRSFALSAAVHGRRRPQPAAQLYPLMRAAVVMTAFFLVLAATMNLFSGGANPLSMAANDSAGGQYEAVAVAIESVAETAVFDEEEIMEMAAAPEAADEDAEGAIAVMSEPEEAPGVVDADHRFAAEEEANANDEAPPAAPNPNEGVEPQPTSAPQFETNSPPSSNIWRTLQYVLAAALALLLGATLYLRRRLM